MPLYLSTLINYTTTHDITDLRFRFIQIYLSETLSAPSLLLFTLQLKTGQQHSKHTMAAAAVPRDELSFLSLDGTGLIFSRVQTDKESRLSHRWTKNF